MALLIVGGGLVTKLCLTLATPWTAACQAPLFMGFSRQAYWSGLPFPSPGLFSWRGIRKGTSRDSLVVQWLRLYALNARGPDLIPGQGITSRMPQLKIPHDARKIPHSATKIQCSKIQKGEGKHRGRSKDKNILLLLLKFEMFPSSGCHHMTFLPL